MNWTGRTNYRLSIIHYMLGSNQATRLPNCKQRSGGKIGKQTILASLQNSFLSSHEFDNRDLNPILPGLLNTLQTWGGGVFYPPS